MTYKKLTGRNPSRLVYGKVVIPMKYIVPTLRIDVIAKMRDVGAVEERLSQLIQLEEYCFVEGYHQNIEKEQKKLCMITTSRTNNFRSADLF